ncbi:MAG TPA: ribonuclease PH [Candidatus Methylacidiphilales bacterium]|nr:ribonuclease PH [Candidatus Methylacidiphilales bacterium]
MKSATFSASNRRHDGRLPAQLRPVTFLPGIAPHAAGSVLAKCGRTQVICAVTVEESVPRWMKEQQVTGGWITAEYSMLPYSTSERKARDITKGRLDGRSTEIQRLIGRSVRAVVDLEALGPRTLCIDCDVLAADGGTRTTAITGVYVALELALRSLRGRGLLSASGKSPIKAPFAAISAGIVEGRPLLDLDYVEDKDAATDMNVVMTSRGQFIEVQASGEENTFSPKEFSALLALAASGIRKLIALQKAALR